MSPSSAKRRRPLWFGASTWHDRYLALALLVVAGVVLFFVRKLPITQQLLLGFALVFIAALVLWRSWKQLFGPVLFYDLVRTARQDRIFAHRFLYAVCLFTLLLLVFYARVPGDTWEDLFKSLKVSRSEMQQFALMFFATFVAVQFAAVLFITPAYTAGAIAQEKERRSLEFLLATDLSNREIVLGLMGARMANLMLIIMSGLPMFALLQLLGGVEPSMILAAFVGTLVSVFSIGSLSILVSVHQTRPLPAVLLTYVYLMIALAASAFIPFVNRANPISAVMIVGQSANTPALLDVLLQTLLAYVLIHVSVGLFCCWWAVNKLRAVYLGTAYQPLQEVRPTPAPLSEPKSELHTILEGWGPFPDMVTAAEQRKIDELTAPQPQRAHDPFVLSAWQRVRVGDDAMIWKETRANFHWLRWLHTHLRLAPALGLAGSFVLGLFFTIMFDWVLPYEQRGATMGAVLNPLVRGIGTTVFCFGLLVVALSASGRITREREMVTFQCLRTTPLDGSEILFPKWIASIWTVRGLFWFYLVIWGLGLLTGALHVAALPLLIGAGVIYVTCVASVGLWFSMFYKQTLRATLFTILATLIIIIGPGVLMQLMIEDLSPGLGAARNPEWGERLVLHMLSPPKVMWTLAFYSGNLAADPDALPMNDIAAAVVATHFFFLLTIVLWISLLARFEAEKGKAPSSRAGPIKQSA